MSLTLISSPGSPFARKARIALAEKGVGFAIVSTTNMYDHPDLLAANPNAQVPALVLDDGSSLFDSTVICAWLDARYPEPRLIPDGDRQWSVRRAEAAANGVMENTVRIRMEMLRNEALRSQPHIDRWTKAIRRALDRFEQEPAGELDMGEIALVCALDYVDFRAPHVDWREGRPRLAARHATLSARESFQATRPV